MADGVFVRAGSTFNEEGSVRHSPTHRPHKGRTPSHKGLYGLLRPHGAGDSDAESTSSKSNFELHSEEEKRRPSVKKSGRVRERVTSLIRRTSTIRPDEHGHDAAGAGAGASPEMPAIVFPAASESDSSQTQTRPAEMKDRRRVTSMFHRLTHPVCRVCFAVFGTVTNYSSRSTASTLYVVPLLA